MCNILDMVLNQTIFSFFGENDWNQLCWEMFKPGLKTSLEVSAPKLMKGVKLGQKVFWNQEVKKTAVNM